MDLTIFNGIMRAVIPGVIGYLAGKKVFGFDAETWNIIIAGASSIGMAIWSARSNSAKGIASAAVEKGMPVIAPPEIAHKLESPLVKSSAAYTIKPK